MQLFHVKTCSLSHVLIFCFLKKHSGFLLIICQQTQKSEDITNIGIFLLLNTSIKIGPTRFRRSICRLYVFILKNESIKNKINSV